MSDIGDDIVKSLLKGCLLTIAVTIVIGIGLYYLIKTFI